MNIEIKNINDQYLFNDIFNKYNSAVIYTPKEKITTVPVDADNTYTIESVRTINKALSLIDDDDLKKMISITGYVKPSASINYTSPILNIQDYSKVSLVENNIVALQHCGIEYLKNVYKILYKKYVSGSGSVSTIDDYNILRAQSLYNVDAINLENNELSLKEQDILTQNNALAYSTILGFLGKEDTGSYDFKSTDKKISSTIVKVLNNQYSCLKNLADKDQINVKHIERATCFTDTVKIKFFKKSGSTIVAIDNDDETSEGLNDMIGHINTPYASSNGTQIVPIVQARKHSNRNDIVYFGPFSSRDGATRSHNNITQDDVNNIAYGTFSNKENRYFYLGTPDENAGFEASDAVFFNSNIVCKIYVNLDSCTNGSNAFGIGFTTTKTTPGYIMFRIEKGFLENSDALNTFSSCIDGNWFDVAKYFSYNSSDKSRYSSLIGGTNYIDQVSNEGEKIFKNIIQQISDDYYFDFRNWRATDSQSIYYVDESGEQANEFRIAQYYNPGNILGFFAETNEGSIGTNIYAVGYSRVDYKIPFMLKKVYVRKLRNGHHLWYFYVPFDNKTNKDALIEYQEFKIVVPHQLESAEEPLRIFNISYSDTFYENNMVNENGTLKTPTYSQHTVLPLGRAGVYKPN